MPKWWKRASNLSASCCRSQVGEVLYILFNTLSFNHSLWIQRVSPSVQHMLLTWRWVKPEEVASVESCPFLFCDAGVTKLEKGAVTLGMVLNIDPQRGILVKLPFGGTGAVAITDLADAYRSNPLGGYSKNQIFRLVNRLSVSN